MNIPRRLGEDIDSKCGKLISDLNCERDDKRREILLR
jgi:hypothetical protein